MGSKARRQLMTAGVRVRVLSDPPPSHHERQSSRNVRKSRVASDLSLFSRRLAPQAYGGRAPVARLISGGRRPELMRRGHRNSMPADDRLQPRLTAQTVTVF